MPTVTPPVDVEALLVAYLDPLVTPPVSTELPGDYAGDYVQLWKLPGSMVTPETQWIERARIQFSVWGSTKESAWDAAAATFAALGAIVDTTHTLGVVTACDPEVTPYWSPDPDTDDPRYLFTAAFTVHPAVT